MKTLFTNILFNLVNLLLNNFFFALIFRYISFTFRIITIYLKTFIQLYKSLNPVVASCMFLVYVLNMASYFNSNLNFLGFHKYPTYIPSFVSISYWNNYTSIPWHKISKNQFYSFIIGLISQLIIYSLFILIGIYIFFNLLVYFTDSNLFSFILTLQFSTIIITCTTVCFIYTIIFCKQFLLDIGLTSWIKINLLKINIRNFNLKPFAPNNKYLWK